MRLPALASLSLLGLSATLLAQPARAQQAPQPDPDAIITLDLENDAPAQTDRYYTSGEALNYVSPTTAVPNWLADAGHLLWGAGQQRYSIGLDQALFTPLQTQLNPPPVYDRPYAAELTGNFALLQDGQDWRSDIEVDLGVIGPGALGEEVQNGFHHLIGDTPNKGWSYQIHNEPLVEIVSDRIYRIPMGTIGAVETDFLPELTVGLGNERIYALTGGQFRIGQGLDSDFGAARMRPGLTGMNAYQPTRPFVWYALAGLDGQAIAHDITLNGNSFRSSYNIGLTPFVGEFQAGLAMEAYGFKVSYTEVFQTKEFHTQAAGLFQYGVFTLSTRF
ncbi:MAG: lipid A deacylase LpxR family protein [Acidocella sp.]|nr:lipid A deacylase LpxR family protein [Acidocella sp.]